MYITAGYFTRKFCILPRNRYTFSLEYSYSTWNFIVFYLKTDVRLATKKLQVRSVGRLQTSKVKLQQVKICSND